MVEELPPRALVEEMVRGIPPARWFRFWPEPWATIAWSVRCPCRVLSPGRVIPGTICRAREIRLTPRSRLRVYAGICSSCAAGFWAANWGRADDRQPMELGAEESILCDLFSETWPVTRGGDPEPIRLRGLDPAFDQGMAECDACTPRYANLSLPGLVPLRPETIDGPYGVMTILLGRCERCHQEYWNGRLRYIRP